MSEFYDAEPNYICHNRSVQHQDIRKLCKKPKKGGRGTKLHCLICGVNITRRQLQNRIPSGRVPYCRAHLKTGLRL